MNRMMQIIAAALCVAFTRTTFADDPWPSYELVANGDFEGGTVVSTYKENATSAYLPGWTTVNACIKSKIQTPYVTSGLNMGTYAMGIKSNSGYIGCIYQDVTVPEDGVYTISFNWAARPTSGNKSYNKQTVQVSFSAVENGVVATTNVLSSFTASTYASLSAFTRTIDVTAGTYRLMFYGSSSSDSATFFDKVSVRKVDTLLTNGYFDGGTVTANSGAWSYSNDSGFSCPGWTLNSKCGLTKTGTTWVSPNVGAYSLYVQSNGTDAGEAYQDVEIKTPGLYTLAFEYAARPSHTGQTASIYFGQITAEKTDVTDDDLLEALTVSSASFTAYSRSIAVTAAGTYRLKFKGTSTSDKATNFDKVRLYSTEELIENGDFEEGMCGTGQAWGSYASATSYSNPGWTVNNTGRVGLGIPFGTWIQEGLEVGKYGMFIQTANSSGDITAYQDVTISAPGTYRLALNYVARPGNFTGQTIKISFGLLSDDAITDDLIGDQFTTTTSDSLTPYEKYITVDEVGTYRLLFTALSSSKDCATSVDCISLRRQTEYCFWTGAGDGVTFNQPANWGREVLSAVDDLCFTNTTALALSLTNNITASSVNFWGSAGVSIDGLVEDNGSAAVTTNTLTVGKFVSTMSESVTFDCPVAFTTTYNVNSVGVNKYNYGATATGFGTVAGDGGVQLDGTLTLTDETATLSTDLSLLAESKLYANNLAGTATNMLTIASGARMELTEDLDMGSGSLGKLRVSMADGAELFMTNGTVNAWYSWFTKERKYGTVWAKGIKQEVTTSLNGGFYAGRINLGSGGVTSEGSYDTHLDINGTYTFGAYEDWTWAVFTGNCYTYSNAYVFDTLDCFDSVTPHTITIKQPLTVQKSSHAATLRKINDGTLVLATNQLFASGVYLEGGKIVVSAKNGAGMGAATLASGTVMEVVEGGILANSSVVVASGATLALTNGSAVACAITSTGTVSVAGNVALIAGVSFSFADGGAFSFAEGAKITIDRSMQDGTLVTGSGLTAAQLATWFDAPGGAVSLNDDGDIVYSSAYAWSSYAAREAMHYKYGVAASANVLIGSTCDDSNITRYIESSEPGSFAGTSSSSILTDGDVHFVGQAVNAEKIYSLKSGTMTWAFAATNIAEIAVFTRWGGGGRDGIAIDKVYVKYAASNDWTQVMAPAISVGMGDNNSSAGSICAVLKRLDGSPIAENVTGLKIVFPAAQDNSGSGYTEVAAYASVPSSHSYTWSNATGNSLFSDAGNWTDDATSAAAGEAGATFAPTCLDSLTFPASSVVTVDASATVYTIALNSGVTLNNPSESTTNTLTLCTLSNAGTEMATVNCGTEFQAGYEVSLSGIVNFAGGATAWALGSGTNSYEHVLKGDITFLDDIEISDGSTFPYTWTVPSGSRLTAPALMKATALGYTNQNGYPGFCIEEGGYAHFGSVAVGRDNLYLSVQGEIEVDGLYTTRSAYTGGNAYIGDFGYTNDHNYASSTIRAGGLQRVVYNYKGGVYTAYYSDVYPANLYIGALGISQTSKDWGIRFVGCPKNVYATADFSIRGNTATNGRLELLQDTTLDTQGHTVTMTSNLFGDGKFTKTGEGTFVLACGTTNALTQAIAVEQGTLAISNNVTQFSGGVDLAAGTTLAIDVNSTSRLAAVKTLTATNGAVTVKVYGSVTGVTEPVDITLATSYTPVSDLSFDKSELQITGEGGWNASLRRGNGKLLLHIDRPGLVITIK